jgi:hypothetical protein
LTREATLSARIVDAATGRPTPARVTLQDSNGARPHVTGALAISDSAIPIPKQAIALLWGRQDQAEGYALQPDGSFYVDGAFDVRLPPGSSSLTIGKGFEYVRREETVGLASSAQESREYRLERWSNLPAEGWYSSDDHIHLRRSSGDDSKLLRWIAAEDIHVGNLLQMGDFWSTYFSQYAFGEKGRYQEEGCILSSGAGGTAHPGDRPHDFVRRARVRADVARLLFVRRLFDKVRELGGVTGFVHQGMMFHGYRGMALNTLRGKTDFLELAQFCVQASPLAVDHYYRFLNLGYKLTALARSDFPWCGPKFAQIGNARFYAYSPGSFSYERWFGSVRAGHTFVTTGPMVFSDYQRQDAGGHRGGPTWHESPDSRRGAWS